MSNPAPAPEFSPWEHLQSVLMRVHNELVAEEFRDVSGDDDINVPRSSLRLACRIRDDDTSTMCLIRIWLLMGYIRRASAFHPPLYIQPVEEFQAKAKYKPQITLYFEQDLSSIPEGKYPVEGYVSFRLHNETSQSISNSELTSLGNAIKREFGAGGGFRYSKGKKRFLYQEQDRGYDFRLHVVSESEARELITKVLSVRNHTPNWSELKEVRSEKTYSDNPGTEVILGKPRPRPRQRPTATVRFQYAEISIHGIPNSIVLYDRSGSRINSLVR